MFMRSSSELTPRSTGLVCAYAGAAMAATTRARRSRKRCRATRGALLLHMIVLHEFGEIEKSGADSKARPQRRIEVDGEAHLAGLDEESGNASGLGEPIAIADRHHRRRLELVDDLLRAAQIDARHIKQMARAEAVRLDAHHRDFATVDVPPLHRGVEGVGDGHVA